MQDKKLTVIISFLNERYEVENTLESIREHVEDPVDILLINDASDDGFNYKAVAKKYRVTYIENKIRMGVAASRDLGVERCKTPYFLLLDAHMRFYNPHWVHRIVAELEADERTLLCCQTKSLKLKNGLEIQAISKTVTYGAYVEFADGKELIEPKWLYRVPGDNPELQTVPIVCVLGAGYACSKTYWTYLKGLSGLLYYGSDEPYISMKVWMEGGSCKLLKDVVIGHIYRIGAAPYNTDLKYHLYNRLLIAELFFPPPLKKEIVATIRYFHPAVFPESMAILYEKRDTIAALKNHYHQIFSRPFSYFVKLNAMCCTKPLLKEVLVDTPDHILARISRIVTSGNVSDIGLLKGKMGRVIFLFHYGRFAKNGSCTTEAESILSSVVREVKPDLNYSFYSGLTGIGWGIEYLHQQGFVEGDTNEILEDFDKRVLEIDPKRIQNVNRNYGLGGIVLYVLARLYTIEKENKKNPFDEEYLFSLYTRITSLLHAGATTCDCVDVFWAFIRYYDRTAPIERPELYDVWCLLNWANTPLQDLDAGLEGVAGVGLKLMLDESSGTSEGVEFF